MSDTVTNELLLRNLQEMHRKIDEFRAETKSKLGVMDDKLTAMREHVGAQQLDIANLYGRLEFLSSEIDRIKAQLAPKFLDH